MPSPNLECGSLAAAFTAQPRSPNATFVTAAAHTALLPSPPRNSAPSALSFLSRRFFIRRSTKKRRIAAALLAIPKPLSLPRPMECSLCLTAPQAKFIQVYIVRRRTLSERTRTTVLIRELLRGRGPCLPPRTLIESFRHAFAGLRPRCLYLRAQSIRHRFRSAFAARHATDIRRIASHLLRNAVVNASAKRRQALQIQILIIRIIIVVDAVHSSSRCFECSRHALG
jgi:hypothetical protein